MMETHIVPTMDTFYIDDNLTVLQQMKPDSVDMIYLDPPYNTGRHFHYFDDHIADFPQFMKIRLTECHRVLKKEGNIIIHVEPRISHHIRVLCDELFGKVIFKTKSCGTPSNIMD